MNAINSARGMKLIEQFENLHLSGYVTMVNEIEQLRQRVQELTAERDELLAAAVMAVEMIEYDKHERRHVRWKLSDAIASVKEK